MEGEGDSPAAKRQATSASVSLSPPPPPPPPPAESQGSPSPEWTHAGSLVIPFVPLEMIPVVMVKWALGPQHVYKRVRKGVIPPPQGSPLASLMTTGHNNGVCLQAIEDPSWYLESSGSNLSDLMAQSSVDDGEEGLNGSEWIAGLYLESGQEVGEAEAEALPGVLEEFGKLEADHDALNRVTSQSKVLVAGRRLIPRKENDAPVDELLLLRKTSLTTLPNFTALSEGRTVPTGDDLPFYYPKVLKWRISWQKVVNDSDEPKEEGDDEENGSAGSELELRVDVVFTADGAFRPHMPRIAAALLEKLGKWVSKSVVDGGYQKRMKHDVVVSNDAYYNMYYATKAVWKPLVMSWPEGTDAAKFVYEDVAIASWLMALWGPPWELAEGKVHFADVGCGNGLLVAILSRAGYKGFGMDLRARRIWSKFREENSADLRACPILPPNGEGIEELSKADWLLGNHSDELTPWIPWLGSSLGASWWVLPCCFWDFGRPWTVKPASGGRYAGYLEYVKSIGTELGFAVEQEVLRIPSTKNISFIGRALPDSATSPSALEARRQLLSRAKFTPGSFQVRVEKASAFRGAKSIE